MIITPLLYSGKRSLDVALFLSSASFHLLYLLSQPKQVKFQQPHTITSQDANCHGLCNSPLIMSMWVLAYVSWFFQQQDFLQGINRCLSGISSVMKFKWNIMAFFPQLKPCPISFASCSVFKIGSIFRLHNHALESNVVVLMFWQLLFGCRLLIILRCAVVFLLFFFPLKIPLLKILFEIHSERVQKHFLDGHLLIKRQMVKRLHNEFSASWLENWN